MLPILVLFLLPQPLFLLFLFSLLSLLRPFTHALLPVHPFSSCIRLLTTLVPCLSGLSLLMFSLRTLTFSLAMCSFLNWRRAWLGLSQVLRIKRLFRGPGVRIGFLRRFLPSKRFFILCEAGTI